MGIAKEQWERGITPLEEKKYVCKDCVECYGLKAFIEENATENECSYCSGKSEETLISVRFNDVAYYILERIEQEWSDYDNYGLSEMYDVFSYSTYDLFHAIPIEIENKQLFDDIHDFIGGGGKRWTRNPYGDPIEGNHFWNMWEAFSYQVKHHTRHVFYKVPQETVEPGSLEFNAEPCHSIMDTVAEAVKRFSLIKEIPKGTELFRARYTHDNETFSTVEELGTPSTGDAKKPNRMSPAGIPMFYGALEEETAGKEVICDPPKEKRGYVTTARFQTLEDFKILDLTELPALPCLFGGKSDLRGSIEFLGAFTENVSEPIVNDGREHIEYVPTQVVTEFFRHIFRDNNGDVIKGIIYPSSKNENGRSCVLFFKKEHCTQDNYTNISSQDKKWLSMISSSVRKREFEALIEIILKP